MSGSSDPLDFMPIRQYSSPAKIFGLSVKFTSSGLTQLFWGVNFNSTGTGTTTSLSQILLSENLVDGPVSEYNMVLEQEIEMFDLQVLGDGIYILAV